MRVNWKKKPRCGQWGVFYIKQTGGPNPKDIAVWPICFREPGHPMPHRDAHDHEWTHPLGDTEAPEPKLRERDKDV